MLKNKVRLFRKSYTHYGVFETLTHITGSLKSEKPIHSQKLSHYLHQPLDGCTKANQRARDQLCIP